MNLVEIRVTVYELSCYIGALRTDGQMDRRTDGQTLCRQYPFGLKGRGVKMNEELNFDFVNQLLLPINVKLVHQHLDLHHPHSHHVNIIVK